ncbi:MAG TPA: hypothetical protein VF005_07480, partial [Acidimicrobiales bacterium]
RVHLPMVHLTTVSGDRIAERVTYHDTAGVLRQLRCPPTNCERCRLRLSTIRAFHVLSKGADVVAR